MNITSPVTQIPKTIYNHNPFLNIKAFQRDAYTVTNQNSFIWHILHQEKKENRDSEEECGEIVRRNHGIKIIQF